MLAAMATWGIRTSKGEWNEIHKWLKRGILRQGWGGEDLNLVGELVAAGEANDDQRSIWRYTRRMLDIEPGDLIVTPHQPEWGQEGVWRATSSYRFDPLPDYWGPGEDDFGNVVEVEPLGVIDHRSAQVDADLRTALTSGFRSRMRQLHDYEAVIEALLDNPEAAHPADPAGNFEAVRAAAREAFGEALLRQYRNADFEQPIRALLEVLYPGSVRHTAGPAENGADFVVEHTDPFGLTLNVVVQVKAWKGTVDDDSLDHGLSQLERRIVAEAGNVDLAVLITLADELPDDLDEKIALAESKTAVSTRVIDRDATLELLLSNLAHMEM